MTRVPPHDLDLEHAVLASCANDPTGDAYVMASAFLSERDFYAPSNQWIWKGIAALSDARKTIDLVMLASWLKEQGRLVDAGGITGITGLANDVGCSDLEAASKKLQGLSRIRTMISTCQKLAAEGYGKISNAQVFLDNAAQAVGKAAESSLADDLKPMREVMLDGFQQIHAARLARESGTVPGIATGYAKLDQSLQGLRGGDLYILAARPGMGKSSMALSTAINAVLSNGPVQIGTVFFSLEMPAAQLAIRAASSEAGIALSALRGGFPVNDIELAKAGDLISSEYFLMCDRPGIRLNELRSAVRRACSRMNGQIDGLGRPVKLGLVIIDYLQLIDGSNGKSSQNREQEISEISRVLKNIAKEYDVAVVALSQLSRDVERRPDKRPHLADLRESGAIEANADCVMFLYRDEYYNPDTADANILEVIIAKQRNGPIGTVYLRFDSECTRVQNLAEDYVSSKQERPRRRSRWEPRHRAEAE